MRHGAENQRRYRERHPEYRERERLRMQRRRAEHPGRVYLTDLASRRRRQRDQED